MMFWLLLISADVLDRKFLLSEAFYFIAARNSVGAKVESAFPYNRYCRLGVLETVICSSTS